MVGKMPGEYLKKQIRKKRIKGWSWKTLSDVFAMSVEDIKEICFDERNNCDILRSLRNQGYNL